MKGLLLFELLVVCFEISFESKCDFVETLEWVVTVVSVLRVC